MEDSKIYDLIGGGLLSKWRRQIEAEEGNTWFFTNAEETLAELDRALDEQAKELLKSYALALENKLNYINYYLNIKYLNFGMKIGTQIEKAFAEFED